MELNEAIEEQITRLGTSEDSEVKSLLRAFIYIITAYLERTGETPKIEKKKRGGLSPSDFFASTG